MVKEKKEKKEMIAIIPKEVQDQLNNLPKKDRDSINEAIDKLCTGEVEGEPFEPVELKKKLMCGECGSKNIHWFQDKHSKEVNYFCDDCGLSAWMYDWEYEEAMEKHPDLVFENNEEKNDIDK